MTSDVYLTYYPAPVPNDVGYIELDGMEGLTNQSEVVMIGDSVDPGLVIRIDKCNNW